MKHIFHFYNKSQEKHYVYVAEYFTYSYEDTGWMRDENLPKEDVVYTPSLDIVEKEFVFSTEDEALEKLSTEYGRQSKEIRDLLEKALDCIKGNADVVQAVVVANDILKFLKGE